MSWRVTAPQLGVRTTTTSCCSTEVHPHAGVLPCTVTLTVCAANPGAVKSRSYLPGGPGTTHEVVPAAALHWAEPDAAPESVRVRPVTGPPLAEDTRTTMAIGSGHGGGRQSGFVGPLHPIHATRTTAGPRTPRRPSVIALALRLPPTRSAEHATRHHRPNRHRRSSVFNLQSAVCSLQCKLLHASGFDTNASCGDAIRGAITVQPSTDTSRRAPSPTSRRSSGWPRDASSRDPARPPTCPRW